MIAEFSYLSDKNKAIRKQTVAVMNGAIFEVLVLPRQELLKASNILYLHIHRESRRCYIGITIMTAQMRWGTGNPYRNNPRFGNAIKKYGWEAFDSYVVAFAEDRQHLEQAEIEAIELAGGHKSKFTYNMSPGGDIVSDTGKPVVGVNLQTGESFHFKSSSAAARELDLGDPDRPATVARGLTKSTKGWWFRFEDDTTSQPPTSWGEIGRIKKLRELQGKRVIAVHLKTGENRIFETTNEAGKALGMTQSIVSSVALGHIKSSKGWWFKYENDSSDPPTLYGTDLTRSLRDKKVFAVHLQDGHKREFRNCTVADNELGIYKGASAMVCSGERTSAAGWWFSYDRNATPPTEYKGALVAKARSKPIVAINIDTNEESLFPSAKDAGIALGICRSAISQVIAGKKKQSKGYTFRFAN